MALHMSKRASSALHMSKKEQAYGARVQRWQLTEWPEIRIGCAAAAAPSRCEIYRSVGEQDLQRHRCGGRPLLVAKLV